MFCEAISWMRLNIRPTNFHSQLYENARQLASGNSDLEIVRMRNSQQKPICHYCSKKSDGVCHPEQKKNKDRHAKTKKIRSLTSHWKLIVWGFPCPKFNASGPYYPTRNLCLMVKPNLNGSKDLVRTLQRLYTIGCTSNQVVKLNQWTSKLSLNFMLSGQTPC